MKFFLPCLLLILLGLVWKAQAAQTSPNIILIVADDMGYGDLDHPTISLPNLRQMRDEGVTFTQFSQAAPLCTPARSSMLTGRLPVRNGIYTSFQPPVDELFRVFYPCSVGCLPEEEVTIADALKARDYTSYMIGKWHVGHNPERGCNPTSQGFDWFYGMPYSHEEGYPGPPPEGVIWPPVPLMLNEKIVEQPFDSASVTSSYRELAVDIVRRRAQQESPFFMHLAFENPHVPLFTGQDFQGSSIRGAYGDSMAEMDSVIGDVLAAVREEGLAENTLVYFTSDNGAWVNPNSGLDNVGNRNSGIGPTDGGSNAYFSDGKGSTWEGGMRVPSIAWWPGKLPAGTINRVPFSGVDLLPTFLEAAGIPLSEFNMAYADDDDEEEEEDSSTKLLLDGVSVLDWWQQDGGKARDVVPSSNPHEYMYLWRESELYAIRGGKFKAHFITRSGFDMDDEGTVQDPPLLFDVEADPGELFPLDPEAYEDVLEDLKSAAQSHVDRMEMAPSQYLPLNWSVVPCCQHGPFSEDTRVGDTMRAFFEQGETDEADIQAFVDVVGSEGKGFQWVPADWGLILWKECLCEKPFDWKEKVAEALEMAEKK